MRRIITLLLLCGVLQGASSQTPLWEKWELVLTSDRVYKNPLYDLKELYFWFHSPSGRKVKINGFWNGGKEFRVRFAPDEIGEWTWESMCSDEENTGLHGRKGSFSCTPNERELDLFQRGSIRRQSGSYHLTYDDGTPFFFTACTAWNGALKSTEQEWEAYLTQRKANHYNVIQFVAMPWRGGSTNAEGEVAFTGSGRVSLNPGFFRRIDEKVDQINAHGLVAAPVLLWALPVGQGREYSPGYYLPQNEAILLARYLVARYGGNQVIWILGGDGRYVREYEQRWKVIGREVFKDDPPGVVAQHPHGSSWIGEAYKDESWLDIVGYQSSHSNRQGVVDWINKGPMANTWDKLPARPIINLEPNYEEIRFVITAEDVRNASYWSIFNAPMGGITYGANGIWPWIQQEGELIENHGNPNGKGPSTWRKSIDFPGSLQIGYLSAFIQQFDWWELKPAKELLVHQPGDSIFNHFIPVVATANQKLIMAYSPVQQDIMLRLGYRHTYQARWFDPVGNKYLPTEPVATNSIHIFSPPQRPGFCFGVRSNLKLLHRKMRSFIHWMLNLDF